MFAGTAGIVVGFALWAMLLPAQADSVISATVSWIAESFGWYYVLTAGVVVVFVVVVALSRLGRVRLGPDHAVPQFSMFTWSAMLFAAGIGVDLMFFATSGPATNLLTPPDLPPMSDEAARMAPLWTIFHYGIPGWAMYALMGMAFGLFAYRYHMPLSIRSAIAPIFGRRVHGGIGHAAEIGATVGTIFGIAVSLGIGVVFLNAGLALILDVPVTTGVQIALMALAVGITIISTVSGVDKGIRRLSELNVYLAVVILLWVLLTGRTTDLLNALVQNIGDFFASFPSMMMRTFAYTDGTAAYPAEQWMSDWTLFFWAWWIAWAPFVSLFLARISRGRTLREFVLGVLLIPFAFIMLWVSIMGNAAIGLFRDGDDALLQEAVTAPEAGFFSLLQQFPGATFLIGLAVFTGLFFYVTSADSGSLIMANMTSKGSVEDSDGAPWLRITWAVITGLLTLSMLFIDGVYTLQKATVIVGLPLSVLVYLVMISLWRVLRSESLAMDSRTASLPHVLSGRVRDANSRATWRQRLARRMNFATAKQAAAYVDREVCPALSEVAAELREHGADVDVTRGTHPESGVPWVDLTVRFPGQTDFKYQVYPVAYPVPSFAGSLSAAQDTYVQLEVFSAKGSRGRDVMGYSREQLCANILDDYEAHLAFMTMTGDDSLLAARIDAEAPEVWTDADHSPATDALPTVALQTTDPKTEGARP
ncbi:choline BCCT transporter BetT [Micrococcus luteus]|uniref:choline BCCT transporter BetT n=1 Tax=Micrococcus luteus TaxID=1270 RepID=UPI00214FD4F2|nr:choline BCCT transporter BetT [Micrococcus luteus]MCR4488112.1 choline BCCT transporter BetT [Micrococcus luteus]MCV7505588.1 choline BCCT transporter BetT [Micrococcus luteus]MCV7518889.1 choline BCCT transporter BetT [Micrococcus luteus]MCV7568301.1 choline BCCT transporter BetT [Micrococcus luteus]